jgi:hypothetical protein
MDSRDIGMLNFLAFVFTLPVISMFESTGLRRQRRFSPLMPKDWTVLHNIGQKYIAETSDKLFWDIHVIAKTSQEKVATY